MARRDNAAIIREYAGTDMLGTALLKKDVKVPHASILLLNSPAYPLITYNDHQTDTGMGIVVAYAVFHKPATAAAYTGVNTLHIRHTGSAEPMITVAQATVLNNTTALTRLGMPVDTDLVIAPATNVELFASANPGGGTVGSFLYVSIYYYLAPLNLAARF